MERDQDKRLTASQALKHKWIQRKVHHEFDVEIAKETFQNLLDFRVRTNGIMFLFTLG